MNWLEKISQAADKVATVVEQAASKTVKTYQEKGFEGIVEKTGEVLAKTGRKVDEVTGVATEKTTEYLKQIGEANKEIKKGVEDTVGKDGLKAKIAAGLAVTANTTQTMVDDLTVVGKRTYQRLAENESVQAAISNLTKSFNEIVNTPEEEHKLSKENIAQLDSIPLDVVLNNIISATSEGNNKWIDNQGNKITIFSNSWYVPSKNIGSKNAISLTAYYLATASQMDFNNEEHRLALEENAIKVLTSYLHPVAEVDVKVDVKVEDKVKADLKDSKVVPKLENEKVVKAPRVKKVSKTTSDNLADTQSSFAEIKKPVIKKEAVKRVLAKNSKANEDTKVVSTKASKPVTKKVTTSKIKKVEEVVVNAPVKRTRKPV